MNSDRFAHGSDRSAGDHARSWAGRQHHDVGCAEVTLDRMSDRASFERNRHQFPLAVLDRLFDRGRNLVGLSVARAHASAAVADDDHPVEAETTATLDHRGTPADLDDLFDQIAAALAFAATGVAAAPFAALSRFVAA